MCIRDRRDGGSEVWRHPGGKGLHGGRPAGHLLHPALYAGGCLLYTSEPAEQLTEQHPESSLQEPDALPPVELNPAPQSGAVTPDGGTV